MFKSPVLLTHTYIVEKQINREITIVHSWLVRFTYNRLKVIIKFSY
jgi:hypothetical protein